MPWRKSLHVQFLLPFFLIAVCSIAATAFLTSPRPIPPASARTAEFVQDMEEFGQNSNTWKGAEPIVARFQKETGQRAYLTDPDNPERVLLKTFDGAAEPRGEPESIIYPPDLGIGDNNKRAKSFLEDIRKDQKEFLSRTLPGVDKCLKENKVGAELWDDERPFIWTEDEKTSLSALEDGLKKCDARRLDEPTHAERDKQNEISELFEKCLRRQNLQQATLEFSAPYEVIVWHSVSSVDDGDQEKFDNCADSASGDFLRRYVAEPAAIHVGTLSSFELLRLELVRPLSVGAGMVVLTALASAVTAYRLIRPLRALAEAAMAMPGDEKVRVENPGDDEIGRVARAFNAMADDRERATNRRKQMISDISHELRSPLTNIYGDLEAIHDGLVSPTPERITSLLGQAEQIKHVIEDLRTLDQADTGTLRLNLQRVSLHKLLAEAKAVYDDSAARAGLTLDIRPHDALQITVDVRRMNQALGNLITNAIRHTPQCGNVTLHAHTDGGDVLINVTDTGEGLNHQEQQHVFDRFWRGDKSRSRHSGGSGLGLAIARQIMETHGGTVEVESAPGEGATFTLRLPTRP
ncbi:HAMP domain-containing histidine kinase [Streptomyces phaeochromogenes]|uniref:sensor histidine kinase n=1 Tax=Streptomyces phaeochromogenes TaxID=1923 RepID=UPI00224EA0C4|nr:HAMP domain-containing sensor histidine kinase [Streptomyces phaeochromogenes]MCX5601201.1 HAMP domain-containing histidine kinase [Streptomyces phaeochromogenes]